MKTSFLSFYSLNPQTSPMNWLVVFSTMTLVLSTMNMKQMKMTPNKTMKKSLKMNLFSWKW